MTNPNNNCKKNDIRCPINTKFSQSSHATLFTHTLPIVPSLHMKNKAVFRRNKTDFGFSKRLLEVSKRRLNILRRRFKLLKRRLCSHTPVQIFRAFSPYYNIPPTNTITTITATVTNIQRSLLLTIATIITTASIATVVSHTKKAAPAFGHRSIISNQSCCLILRPSCPSSRKRHPSAGSSPCGPAGHTVHRRQHRSQRS